MRRLRWASAAEGCGSVAAWRRGLHRRKSVPHPRERGNARPKANACDAHIAPAHWSATLRIPRVIKTMLEDDAGPDLPQVLREALRLSRCALCGLFSHTSLYLYARLREGMI
jgi:hypothetical protein